MRLRLVHLQIHDSARSSPVYASGAAIHVNRAIMTVAGESQIARRTAGNFGPNFRAPNGFGIGAGNLEKGLYRGSGEAPSLRAPRCPLHFPLPCHERGRARRATDSMRAFQVTNLLSKLLTNPAKDLLTLTADRRMLSAVLMFDS